ncbi:MAG: hypothetical protein KIC94_12760 [Clostridiales bacterium]|nr:hypothetical protein [Clostridiales bacterium]
MSKGRYKEKKTHQQAKQYSEFIQKNPFCGKSTVETMTNSTLTGSDEVVCSEINAKSNEAIKEKTFISKLLDGDYKEKIIAVIITSILIPMLFTAIKTSYDFYADKKLNSYRLSELESKLETIEVKINDVDNKSVTKIEYEKQISALKEELKNNSSKSDISLLEGKINLLEKEIEIIDRK